MKQTDDEGAKRRQEGHGLDRETINESHAPAKAS